MANTQAGAAEPKVSPKLNKRTPDYYLFKLLRKLRPVYNGQPYYGGPVTIPSECDILWATKENGDFYGIDEKVEESHSNFQVRKLRYVPSVNSVFEDEQKGITARVSGQFHPILDNPIVRDKLTFQRGEIRVRNSEKNLYNYLRCSGFVSNQHPNAQKLKMVDPLYELIDFGYQDEQVVKKGQIKQKAYELAKTARDIDIAPHARLLGISLVTPDGMERDMDAIKTEYIDYSLSNPDFFVSTFNDPKTKVIYKIRNLFDYNLLTLEEGAARWAQTRTFICQLPNGEDHVEYLAKLSMTEEGKEFSNNLNSVYNDLKTRNKTNTFL